jgi:hypothetical protein
MVSIVNEAGNVIETVIRSKKADIIKERKEEGGFLGTLYIQ